MFQQFQMVALEEDFGEPGKTHNKAWKLGQLNNRQCKIVHIFMFVFT